MPEISITKVIQRSGIQRFIYLTPEEAQPLISETHQQVILCFDALEIRTSLVSAGKLGYKLFCNQHLRKAAKVDSGEPIHLNIRPVTGSPELPLPPAFKQALEEAPAALADFFALTTARCNEMIKYVGEAKQITSQVKRIKKCLSILAKQS